VVCLFLNQAQTQQHNVLITHPCLYGTAFHKHFTPLRSLDLENWDVLELSTKENAIGVVKFQGFHGSDDEDSCLLRS
jgi:hypothetical protein